ncbi:MAG TPA: flagellar motor protein MotB [Kofleriaceae bacterium]|nr:flagellar motor protein MotB [Kofleriaceae bacterium]
MAASEPGRRIIKKKSGGHPHHGGAWKVAYADFVTAMMALFMVMWLLASTDAASRKEISQYFRTGILPEGDLAMARAAQTRPAVIENTAVASTRKESLAAEEQAKELGTAIEQMVKTDPELAKLAAQVSISISQEGVLIEAVDRDGQSMLFDLASSSLKPGLVIFLEKLAPLLAQRQNKIRIMGHTDARPYISKNGKTNWDLSYERATNARKVLELSGMPRGQIVSVQAHGPSQPRNQADPYAAENRRLAILVVREPDPEPAEEAPKKGAPAKGTPTKATPAETATGTTPDSAATPTGAATAAPAGVLGTAPAAIPGSAPAAIPGSAPAAIPGIAPIIVAPIAPTPTTTGTTPTTTGTTPAAPAAAPNPTAKPSASVPGR